MPTRTLRARGFALSIDVPERVGHAFRRIVPKRADDARTLVVAPPPPIAVDDHEQEIASFAEFAESLTGSPMAGERVDDVDTHPWYHTIDLLDGRVTPGRYDHRSLVPHLGFPEDLRGKRALDVGSGDGFWAFELERRGADVVSVDIETFADVDLPAALHALVPDRDARLPFRRGVEIARAARGSRIELINTSVYDLSPEIVGSFDLVHAGDLLLHLRDPALALQRLRSVTSGQLVLAEVFDPSLDACGLGPRLTRYRGGFADATWWDPSLSALVQMVVDAGFRDVEVRTTYSIEYRPTRSLSAWRAVVHGRG